MTKLTADIIIDDDRWLGAMDVDAILSSVLCHPEFISGSEMLKQVQHNDISEFSILLTNDPKIQQLNRDFRQTDKPTNVLSFPSDTQGYLGDIAIAFETIEREAIEQNKQLTHHVTHMIIHGILHLLGHDHMNDQEAEEMESLEIKILEDMGVKNPYI